MAAEGQSVIGLDIGGTKIYAGVIDRDGKILATARKKTRPELEFEESAQRIIETVQESIQAAGMTVSDIAAIGIGAPGPLDLEKGEVIFTPNLRWKNAPIRDRIVKAFNKPTQLDNDVNAGVLGEYIFGGSQGVRHMIGLFIGTGIGGGVIIDGKLLHGFNQNAGELGHMIIHPKGPLCGCGNHGCLEAFASKLAIERMIKDAIKKGEKSLLSRRLKEGKRIGSADLAQAYFDGDGPTCSAIKSSARYLGIGLTSYLHIFNPEVVVLGGGIVEALGNEYVQMMIKVVQKHAMPIALRNVQIIPAVLKDNSAILGASVLAWQALEQQNRVSA